MTELEFLKPMKKLTSYFLKDMTKDQLRAWYGILKDVSYISLDNAIDCLVKKSKFFPTISEILEVCEQQEEKMSHEVLKTMWAEGYFKYGEFGELPFEQQERNYDKAVIWLENKAIPNWLARDMENYKRFNLQSQNQNKKLLGA